MIVLHRGNQCTKFEVVNFSHSRDILGRLKFFKNLELKVQSDCVTGRRYEISHLKRLAIEE